MKNALVTPLETPQPLAREAWRAQSEALRNAFEEQLNGPQGIALGFIVMASEYLWEEQRGTTDFAELDARGFVSQCSELLAQDDTLRVFTRTMVAFYAFLAKTGRVQGEVASSLTHALRAAAAEITRPQCYAFR